MTISRTGRLRTWVCGDRQLSNQKPGRQYVSKIQKLICHLGYKLHFLHFIIVEKQDL